MFMRAPHILLNAVNIGDWICLPIGAEGPTEPTSKKRDLCRGHLARNSINPLLNTLLWELIP
jgi:hypothetical protein